MGIFLKLAVMSTSNPNSLKRLPTQQLILLTISAHQSILRANGRTRGDRSVLQVTWRNNCPTPQFRQTHPSTASRADRIGAYISHQPRARPTADAASSATSNC